MPRGTSPRARRCAHYPRALRCQHALRSLDQPKGFGTPPRKQTQGSSKIGSWSVCRAGETILSCYLGRRRSAVLPWSQQLSSGGAADLRRAATHRAACPRTCSRGARAASRRSSRSATRRCRRRPRSSSGATHRRRGDCRRCRVTRRHQCARRSLRRRLCTPPPPPWTCERRYAVAHGYTRAQTAAGGPLLEILSERRLSKSWERVTAQTEL
jgi:hypothetical protein